MVAKTLTVGVGSECRTCCDIKGGTATGSRLQATFLTGGFEFELAPSNGAVELEHIDGCVPATAR